MLFSSIIFICFFLPAVIFLYYIIPQRTYRNCILLLSSLIFYAWGEPKFVILMILSISFNYIMGILISKNENHKKLILALSVTVNLVVIFIFKYLGFSCQIINYIITSFNIKPLTQLNIILPIGISFFTFQEISYLADVYKTPSMVQKNPLNLGLYITFFPQLIAGPIVRYHDINLQITERKESVELFYQGLQRFITGLAKKVILANNFALVCDTIYGTNIAEYGTLVAWIAAISYALQIYYDFSGYSDMAIGLAKLFGFDLLENFDYPYSASSITDFWKRWHISLTNFFRDYVYIPLGGNRNGKARAAFNRFFVFFLTGLWHGAAINFIIWGLLHGAAMVLERTLKLNEIKNKPGKFFYRILTLIVICLLWVLFRNDFISTISLWLKMIGINWIPSSQIIENAVILPLKFFYIDIKFIIILVLGITFAFPWWKNIHLNINDKVMAVIKSIILTLIFIVCIASLSANTYNPFIYFRF